ncbi:MAG: hypothetical protein ACP5HU_00230 [Phycisphaerae bacterium]
METSPLEKITLALLCVFAATAAPSCAQDQRAEQSEAPVLSTDVGVPAPAVRLDEPYEAAFRRRAQFYIRQTAERDPDALLDWFDRTDYFSNGGGDPHKYAMPVVLARLYMDPTDEGGLRLYRFLMEVDKLKRDRGLYHFSIFQRTRLFFQMGEDLPDDVVESNLYDTRNFFHIMRSGGTENHRFMSRCSGYVWAEYLDERFPDEGFDEHKQWLADWVTARMRQFYTVGQGEYDSSTYVGFSAASLANIYDFSADETMRDTARATLDWLAAAYARKYFHGLNIGPEARGFAHEPVGTMDAKPSFPGTEPLEYSQTGTHTDWVAWLWWDDSARGVWMERQHVEVNRYPALNLALSSYRPHRVIRNIAAKNVPMPYEARGSKPSYEGNEANKDQEILYFNDQYAMGTLYSPEQGVRTSGTILPQTTMFKAVLLDDRDVQVFGASNGYHGHFPLEGRSPFDQYHQARDAAINICYVTGHEELQRRGDPDRVVERSIFGAPVAAGEPVRSGGWFFWQVNKAYLAARPLNGQAEFAELPDHSHDAYRWLVSPGKLTGWVVQLGQQSDYQTFGDFQSAVLNECELDLSQFAEERTVTFTSLRGDVLKMRHTGGPGGRPDAWTNGEKLDYGNWPVFESPYVREEIGSGVLELNDGVDKLTIDVSGDRPRFIESSVE